MQVLKDFLSVDCSVSAELNQSFKENLQETPTIID